jgi:hypothetical protein
MRTHHVDQQRRSGAGSSDYERRREVNTGFVRHSAETSGRALMYVTPRHFDLVFAVLRRSQKKTPQPAVLPPGGFPAGDTPALALAASIRLTHAGFG